MTYVNSLPVLAALADPTRCAIYEKVARAPTSVTDIANDLPVSRPAVSQHLKVLTDAGLVQPTRKGRQQIYSADRRGLDPLRTWLDGLWDDVLGAFADKIEMTRT